MTKQEQIKQKQNEIKKLPEEVAKLSKDVIKVAKTAHGSFTIGIKNPYPARKSYDITDTDYQIRMGIPGEEMKKIADEIYKLLED